MALTSIMIAGFVGTVPFETADGREVRFRVVCPQGDGQCAQTFNVHCDGILADHVYASVKERDSVVVSGTLLTRKDRKNTYRQFIHATLIGFDLRFGEGSFTKIEQAETHSQLA